MERTVAFALVLAAAMGARGDEGMWTYDNFPKDKLAQKYGFRPDDRWLSEARLSSVRLAGGCSSSFVSPDGLVITNHHCAHECIEHLSTPEKNYVKDGFYAKEQEQEVRCPEIELNQLLRITDVTKQINDSTKGLTGDKYVSARQAAIARVEEQCAHGDAGRRCDVVTLYHGGLYDLYEYKRFQDVRLVFAPEFAIAFFGGDPDNFNFPRYDLDVSFLRAYENGRPARTEHFFKWSPNGARDGELTFVSGNPGETDRELTVAQLRYQRDVANPDTLAYYAQLRGFLGEYVTKGPEQARNAEVDLFYVENSFKVYNGRQQALADPALFAMKEKQEAALRKKTAGIADAKGAWDAIADSIGPEKRLRTRLYTLEGTPKHAIYIRPRGFTAGFATYFRNARYLVRAAEERTKPDAQRLREYTEAALPEIRQKVLSTAPVHDDYETAALGFSLTKLRENLGPDDPLVRKVFGRKPPTEVARELIAGSKLKDPAVRRQLWEGGKAAVEASNDPMIQLARLVDPDSRAVRSAYEEQVDAVQKRNHALIARARFQVEGTSNYPDATFSLRLSYGSVEGWNENGHPVPPFTTMAGAFERATGSDPFRLPDSWIRARDEGKLRLQTPFDLVTTNDIIGGNSGSPLFDKDLQIVGLVFDGNIHSLGGDFWFDPRLNRTVSVTSNALLEALDRIYGAQRIVSELRGGTSLTGQR